MKNNLKKLALASVASVAFTASATAVAEGYHCRGNCDNDYGSSPAGEQAQSQSQTQNQGQEQSQSASANAQAGANATGVGVGVGHGGQGGKGGHGGNGYGGNATGGNATGGNATGGTSNAQGGQATAQGGNTGPVTSSNTNTYENKTFVAPSAPGMNGDVDGCMAVTGTSVGIGIMGNNAGGFSFGTQEATYNETCGAARVGEKLLGDQDVQKQALGLNILGEALPQHVPAAIEKTVEQVNNYQDETAPSSVMSLFGAKALKQQPDTSAPGVSVTVNNNMETTPCAAPAPAPTKPAATAPKKAAPAPAPKPKKPSIDCVPQ